MGDKPKKKKKQTGAFETQPISQADARAHQTNVAIPNEQNVKRNKDWVDQNQK